MAASRRLLAALQRRAERRADGPVAHGGGDDDGPVAGPHGAAPTLSPTTEAPSLSFRPTLAPTTSSPTTSLPTPSPSIYVANVFRTDQCLCCYAGNSDSICGGPTSCYCCCGDGDDNAIEGFNSCVKQCEKENDGYICDDWGEFLSSSEKSYIRDTLAGECDGAGRARAKSRRSRTASRSGPTGRATSGQLVERHARRGGDPSPEPAASWLATYETSKEPPETVAGVDATLPRRRAADSSLIDGAGRLASHLASLPGRAASTGAMAIAGAGDAAFGAGKERARAVSEFQPLAAVARLVGGDEGAPADGAWAVPSFLAGDFDDDDDGAASRRSRRSCGAGDRREAHELAVGAAATRDALVLALEALAARERARHGVHRRRFRGPRLRETVAAAREARRRPRTSPRAAAPVAVAEHFDDASSSDDDDDDARADVAADGAAAAWAADAGARSA
ncbi:hypothetical protein JL720_101 [Aureococcus anophagefferens]|nr:hypothetical protein JL720_101 [Aureococcus anophagefferens]